ncbi:MAG TPA: Co2+/Mg2+ efflux protein ApaG [Polyangiaceae bacterium]|nr:Co2+/Mg2+ efflux protein ApaG [Polyangiaceae bacterium]
MPDPEAVTQGIRVRVRTEFRPDQSDLKSRRWFFAYTIRISNEGAKTVQLLNRSWVITNAEGRVEFVQGAGVVGEQPVLEPGQSFEYTSGCPLGTPFGSMHGTYEMTTADGERFEVRIPTFVLRLPGTMN